MTNSLNRAAALAVGCLVSAAAWAQEPAASHDAQVKAYVDMMRKDVRKDIRAIVDQAMDLEPADKAKFWTAYSPYEADMKALWDRRLANIKKYAESYPKVPPAAADSIVATSLAIEQDNLAIKKKHYEKMKAELGPVVAARFLQVEMMIGHLVGLQLGADIPLME